MELNLNHIVSEKEAFLKTGISLPSYEIKKVRENTAAAPQWIHFGIGNIFRVFIAGIADSLLEQNCMDSGLICAEVYDREIVDRIYEPYDNLSLTVFLNPDGTREMRVIGSMAEAIQAQPDAVQDWNRLKAAFRSPALQMISFTIRLPPMAFARSNTPFLAFSDSFPNCFTFSFARSCSLAADASCLVRFSIVFR